MVTDIKLSKVGNTQILKYAYDGDLGARVFDNGARVDLIVWSPSADIVSVVLYDKNDQTKVIGKNCYD